MLIALMTNHAHLLITRLASDSLSRIIQHVGRQYMFNTSISIIVAAGLYGKGGIKVV